MKTLDALIDILNKTKEELNKAIKPGPTLDYSKMKPPMNEATHVLDYRNNRMLEPKISLIDKKKELQDRLDAEAKETALETINRRQKMNKNVNMSYSGSPNGSLSQNEQVGMAMSEKEPHKDDPQHEAKEKAKAKKIKEDAQEILDLHKEEGDGGDSDSDGSDCEDMGCHSNGQWFVRMASPKKSKKKKKK